MKKNQLRVIHIIPTLQTGGAERFAVDLAIQTRRDGCHVRVICLQQAGAFANTLTAAGIKLTVLGCRPKFTFLSILPLARLLWRERPDVVHVHLLGGMAYGALAARLARVKRVIATEQNVYGNIFRAEGRGRELMRKLAARFIDVTAAASTAIQKDLANWKLMPKDKIVVIPNGIDNERFAVSQRNYSRLPITVGCVGRLVEQKGFDVIIDAMKIVRERVDKVCLRIAGDGPLQAELARRIQQHGLAESVLLAGAQKDVGNFLQTIDIFAMPSRWEGFGVVLLEAGLHGLPVIASATGGITDIIDKQTGVLVAVEDASALANAIVELANDAGRRQQLGIALQSKIQRQFSISTVAEAYYAVYKDTQSISALRRRQYAMEKDYARQILETSAGTAARRQLIERANSAVSEFKAAYLLNERQGGGELTRRAIKKIAKPGARILDFGCGSGDLVRRPRQHGYQAYGFDVSAYDVATAHHQPATSGGETLVSGDLSAWRQKKFDVIIMDNVIEHIVPDELADTLRQCFDLLKEGGLLYIVTPHRFAGPHDVSRYVLPLGAKADGFHFHEYKVREMVEVLRGHNFTRIHTYPFHPALVAAFGRSVAPFGWALYKSLFLEQLFAFRPLRLCLRLNRSLTRAIVAACFPAVVVAKK